MGMRLNLGCGHRYMTGWVNCDRSRAVKTDRCFDLNTGKLPLPPDSCVVINARAVIEHVERTQLVSIMGECWRVLVPGGCMYLQLPPAAPHLWCDPTHHSGFVPALDGAAPAWAETMLHFSEHKPAHLDYECPAAFQIAWRHMLLFANATALYKAHGTGLTFNEFVWLHPGVIDALSYWLVKPGSAPHTKPWSQWDADIVATQLYPNGYACQHDAKWR